MEKWFPKYSFNQRYNWQVRGYHKKSNHYDDFYFVDQRQMYKFIARAIHRYHALTFERYPFCFPKRKVLGTVYRR